MALLAVLAVALSRPVLRSAGVGGDGAEVETVNLKQVLDSVIRMAQPEMQHRATVVREYEEGNLYIRGSRTRVSQVFLNLIVNAAQAIDGAGEITITSMPMRS